MSATPRAQSAHGDVPAYFTPDQLAAHLQVSPKTVYRWAAQDATMPTLRIGGVVRFPRDRVLRWLQQREQGMGRQRSAKQVLSGSEVRAVVAVAPSEPGVCAAPCAEEPA